MEEKLYVVNFTESQIKNMADFIESNLLDVIRRDEDIDNLLWVNDMCEAYDKLREVEESIKE